MLTTDYGNESDFENRQREETFRGVLSWDHLRENWKVSAKGGYVHTQMKYDYKRDAGNGVMTPMTRSRSKVDTFYGQSEAEYYIGKEWLFTANASVHQHFVESRDKNIIRQDGNQAIVGYSKGRVEFSGAASAKWQPNERIGMSVVLREEMYGKSWTPLIPAFFIDGIVSERGNIMLKASTSRNFRFPTLNDLYFLPGGNPNLKRESGWTYDIGMSFAVGKEDVYSLTGSVNWFDSHVKDWILWLPTTKGFFSPRNVKNVHAYGIECKSNFSVLLGKECRLALNGTFSWTPSINEGEPMSAADQSIGKQLPYVPEWSSNISGRLYWKKWSLLYKWCYYSKRHTMSSNDISLTGKLPEYYMSNLTLERGISLKGVELSLKGAVNNLFNEEYLSVLSRPMPRINFEFFIGITPKF
jgi:iron complex outermembrane receptor protein